MEWNPSHCLGMFSECNLRNLSLQINETNVTGDLSMGNISWKVCGGEKIFLDGAV